jgi:hypothetical protein
MAPNVINSNWLRPTFALCALAGLLALGGCGGGSGAPNNPFAPGPIAAAPLVVLPAAATVFANNPVTLTVSGGTPPYRAFSDNTAVLPVAQNVSNNTIVLLASNVAADTTVTITVQDALGQTAHSTVTVSPSTLLNKLTITPNLGDCPGTTQPDVLCSGQKATASVTVTAPGGAGIPGRLVKFDVIAGDFAIVSSNPATPLVATLTVVSDANGVAQVIIQASVSAPTQPALIRATDLTTGDQVTAPFTIVNNTSGATILAVIPSTATINGADNAHCSAGFRIDYYIYGGTPPYHIASTFPDAVTLVNSTVFVSGGSFEAITNGSCVNPLVFTIVDAIGRQTTAQLINALGTTVPTPPTPAPALVVTPPSYTQPSCGPSNVFPFVITGGTPPYNFSASTSGTPPPSPSYNPPSQTVATNGGGFTISSLKTSSTTLVTVVDSSGPQKAIVATITCNP